MKQLTKDLTDNARERHAKWAEDTIMRCEVVELDKIETAMMLAAILIDELTDLFAQAVEMPEDDFVNMMRQYYRVKLLRDKQQKSQGR